MNLISKNKSIEALLFLAGFVSILGQVILLRELNVEFFGTELIYAIAFSTWMFGTACGALTGRRNYTPLHNIIIYLFILSGLLLPLDIFFIRNIHYLFGGVTGAYLPFDFQIIAMLAALLPFSITTGLLFQWAARNLTVSGKTLAQAYAIESLGGLTGGALSSLLVILGMQNFQITLLSTFICFALLIFLNKNRYYKIFTAIILTLLLFASLNYSKAVDNWMTSKGFGRKVESIDTPYNRITIAALDNQLSFFEDNALTYESETTDAEEFVQLSSLQSVKLNKVLVLGGGFKGIVEQLDKFSGLQIDYVEYNREMYEFIKAHLPKNLKQALSSNKVNVIFKDPRSFLRTKNKYDLILAGMPEPASGMNSRYYTKEFFSEVSLCLNTNGIFSFRIPSSENFWTPVLQKRNAGIYKTLISVFPYLIVLPGTSNIFIASGVPLCSNTDILNQRLKARNISNKLVTPQYVNYIYTNDRYNEIFRLMNDNTAPVNSDLKPACYQYTMTIWLSKFFPQMAQWDFSSIKLSGKLIYKIAGGVFIFLLILVGRKWKPFRRYLIVFTAGLQGMVLEIILILNYQIHNGILFQNIGVLIMGFMLGLSLGAWIIYRLNRKFSGPLLLTLSVLFYFLAGLFLISGYITDFIITLVFLIVTGFLTSGLFAWAGTFNVTDQKKIVSPLYSADLLGGFIGSLVSNFILIPLFGFGASAQLMIFPSLFLFFFL